MNDKLLPCPFCGGEPEVVLRPDGIRGGYFCSVLCRCGGHLAKAHKSASGADESEVYNKAMSAWNRRTQPNEPVKHGKWIESGMFDEHDIKYGRHNYVCNRCKQYALYFVGGSENWWCSSKPSYCPNCGAKMDKESDNT